jgi:hypothetical protein
MKNDHFTFLAKKNGKNVFFLFLNSNPNKRHVSWSKSFEHWNYLQLKWVSVEIYLTPLSRPFFENVRHDHVREDWVRKEQVWKPSLRGQFHQLSMCSFYVRKLHAQLFCAYILGLYFTCERLLAQKLCMERWWNWPLIGKFRKPRVLRA